ncbi:uncharacterized protein [Musca autumnalis]|uniref:uncharacterized protein n=1 Tax=Musca autumnalis TaxID=221902 RepID=UPI003CF8FFF9
MKVIQLNLNHCEAAQDLLKQTVRELEVDLAIISEPYRNISSSNWYCDTSGTSTLWSINKPMQNVLNSELGFVRATVAGLTVYSCYLPPRYDIEEYKHIITKLVNDASSKSPILIAGDFNAWATEWGSPRTNERGRILLESFAQLDVELLNSGSTPTFNRNGGSSIIDITFASTSIYDRFNWQISDMFTYSDHSAIIIKYNDAATITSTVRTPEVIGWKRDSLDKEIFALCMEGTELQGTPENMAKKLILQTTQACNASMKKRKRGVGKAPVYWWNAEIAELRKECLRARRRFNEGMEVRMVVDSIVESTSNAAATKKALRQTDRHDARKRL